SLPDALPISLCSGWLCTFSFHGWCTPWSTGRARQQFRRQQLNGTFFSQNPPAIACFADAPFVPEHCCLVTRQLALSRDRLSFEQHAALRDRNRLIEMEEQCREQDDVVTGPDCVQQVRQAEAVQQEVLDAPEEGGAVHHEHRELR